MKKLSSNFKMVLVRTLYAIIYLSLIGTVFFLSLYLLNSSKNEPKSPENKEIERINVELVKIQKRQDSLMLYVDSLENTIQVQKNAHIKIKDHVQNKKNQLDTATVHELLQYFANY